MSLINRRAKTARRKHADHSYVDMHRIVQKTVDTWVIEVEYVHALTSWRETILATRVVNEDGTQTITIIDGDYPNDRAQVAHLTGTSSVVGFLTDFITAGRW